MHGIGNADTRLSFKLRLVTNKLMEKLGRHRGVENDQRVRFMVESARV